MITIKQHNTTAIAGLGILRDLESFKLTDINEAIEELETKIGKSYFGDGWNNKLQVLYSLKVFSENKKLVTEINSLKEILFNRLIVFKDKSQANVYISDIIGGLQAQGKGREFVRDGLKAEIEKLESSYSAFDLISEDDILDLSAEIGADPAALFNAVSEIIAKRNILSIGEVSA
ncbi:MAG: hypothetical protein L0F95_00840 [Lactococcus sp.]|uniref:Uncharacterized protein n=1 Tax=Pseudolactococcus piscium MKFS47 TaxID=297352 RepID=A0A0D6DZ08_9LACT|nr:MULTISPECIES: hypothetical protein [Lactococcus]MDN5440874.1 hypothetical protein [Lactococcus lactis]MCJ1971569.1 hypothetical protein [Lactococcus carnosus]MDN5410938.1 hypothetical protein [Lactococcus sp.]MDN5461044.1 hypothetical protein [Lactococcus sp.]MDN5465152.1 hypothetical protein [Lactococcus sp.]